MQGVYILAFLLSASLLVYGQRIEKPDTIDPCKGDIKNEFKKQ